MLDDRRGRPSALGGATALVTRPVSASRQNERCPCAKNEADKAKAQTEEATAEADAAESKSAIVADCAKAYFSAFGALFDGESVEDQVPVVNKELQGISDSCKTALGGT